ncbi:Hypp8720 [Branchiostoma lanceolatum]|uniref:Hypp8720 protein n=1 Tax=Branchiostoma lanceolatum TaxID=7740 RepID=A0A8J9ZA51_BRALA|nr:Hypp8720 [Branchiostoma lanceolatum]
MAQGNEPFMPPAVSRPVSAPLRRPPSSQGRPQPWMTGTSDQVRTLSAGPWTAEGSLSPRPWDEGSSGYSSTASLFGGSTSPKAAFGGQQPTILPNTRPKLTPAGHNSTRKIRDCPEIDQYKRLLEKLADRLSPDEVGRLKRQCGVPAGTSESTRNNRDFMQWLVNTDKINQDNLSYLGILLYSVKRPDLVQKIRRYEEDHDFPMDRRTPTIEPSSSSDGTGPEGQTYAHDMAERLDQLRERIERRRQEGAKEKHRAAMIVATVCLALLILAWPLFWLDDLPGIRGKMIAMVATPTTVDFVNKFGPTITVLGETIFGLALMFTVCWLRQEALFRGLRQDFLSDLELLLQPAKKRMKKRVAQV